MIITHTGHSQVSSQTETISQWGARMDTVCGDLQRAARKHMEDLAWTNEKREGGGDIIDLFIRACFIQGLHDDRIKTMVKAKGNINTPMAQLVEVALEEESVIRSERFKRSSYEKGQFGNQGARYVPRKPKEHEEVRVVTAVCYRCKERGHIERNCRELPSSAGEEQVTKGQDHRNKSGNGQRGCLSNRR